MEPNECMEPENAAALAATAPDPNAADSAAQAETAPDPNAATVPAQAETAPDSIGRLEDSAAPAQTDPAAAQTGAVAEPPSAARPAPEAEEALRALESREREIARRETRLLALEELTSRGLPAELLPVLPVEDAETLSAALDGLETAFRSTVEASVHKRMAGAPPVLTGREQPDNALRRAMGLR